MTQIQPVILCGGSGTRLWPRSRAAMPKPFIPLLGERTLFQQALDRVSDTGRFAPPVIVAGEVHAPYIAAQAGAHELILEPVGRNTAPAIALAANRLPAETVMLVCPSDHYIADQNAFLAGVERGAALARDGALVAFGIEPDHPETGYGYIERGEPISGGHRVARFVEKPDLETARRFLTDGGFVWNGGIFLFRAGSFLEELERHRSTMAEQVAAAVSQGIADGHSFHPALEHFSAIEGESVDYAVMENTSHAAVVAADMGWSDIGNWDALMAARGTDGDGNVLQGRVDLIDSRGVMVDSDGPRVSVVGLDDVVVVVDGDEVLVMSRFAAQAVGRLPGATGT